MSFPHHDRNWVEMADFLDPLLERDARVLAPDRFWWRLQCPVQRWVSDNLRPGQSYDWVIVHKGEVGQFPRRFLEGVAKSMVPVFANEVFVVFTRTSRAGAVLDADDPHVNSLLAAVTLLPPEPAEPNVYEQDRVFGPQPELRRFADMSDAELRDAENEFFRNGGYEYMTARDRGYYEDVHRHVRAAMERGGGRRVLDVGCGGLRYVDVEPGTSVVRIDFAEEAVHMAVDADASRPECAHATMDAHQLGFPNASFDVVVFVDAIEHVRNVDRVIAEIARVLRGGGELLVTYANRNSVNQVMTRKLGYSEFVTNHHHFREFATAEIDDLLRGAGLETVETAGVSFYPYWGIPGVDEVVRELIDDDPEVVDMLRAIGARVGREFAYTGVVVAKKR
jgi:2-polyprenyl-3-methyl-5-hydroxy-6-metoxy-1,4-benzoquinol methylase